ncbi:hypothetical protein LEP1GSC036_1791 [Leptospira weilii str. 2006001853]|uniref:Uncharacterized protein n=2 Tax=Leptospira weilii TaxID=28184 RepID=A0A828YW85_9LEPT|nr:hypothetical protein LEP1GSC036_1791 [Leptospira weilii str. 2006001853]EMM74638.1 hypothetical protein LEP1GSC038_0515 [Leptospira weilii str. 2006001855]EMN44509.1 hypothetical protein LEP1GSC086_1963 [Leptospira weilii str. LNT 1234]
MGQKTPSQLYKHSERIFVNRIPEILYPDHFETRKRMTVAFIGKIKDTSSLRV